MNGHTIQLDHPLVIGGGAAGLAVALRLPEATVISAGTGSTSLAQGGIAAAIGEGDHPDIHAADTIACSAGLAAADAVSVLCSRGPQAIRWLRHLGARFDRGADGELRLGLEAGHSCRRIVASHGDSIGREVSRVLGEAVRGTPTVHMLEGWTAVDLVVNSGLACGVVVVDPAGEVRQLLARGVVIATGGAGYLYQKTTNPPDVHGSGIAMAGRAGARLRDLEFVQFHPTAMDVGDDPMPLVTEALRGAGATLIDETERRFVVGAHPAAELAPRDVVARSVWHHAQAGHQTYLDARHVPEVEARFPTVAAAARRVGMSIARDPLPVSPAAHYLMGGIDVDTRGRSSLRSLWAVGEAASTGVHGANRLASNSLLEGLVFAARAAADIEATAIASDFHEGTEDLSYETGPIPPDLATLRRVMWDLVGLVRTGEGLERAVATITELRPRVDRHLTGRAMVDVAGWIARAARLRRESRGGHFRADFPDADPSQARRMPSLRTVEV